LAEEELKKQFGWWLPVSDAHFGEYFASAPEADGRRIYQPQHLRAALGACPERRIAVDVGAHVGMWSHFLAQDFRHVHAFEPVPLFRKCFELNVAQHNVTLHSFALGRASLPCSLSVDPANSGATHISALGRGGAEIRPLDDFELDEVDFIKIDVEGFELFVLEGAQETLLRCRPVLIVEQKEFGARYGVPVDAPERFLTELGFNRIGRVVNDAIFSWRSGS
jgi:FkbM family methyltransferase